MTPNLEDHLPTARELDPRRLYTSAGAMHAIATPDGSRVLVVSDDPDPEQRRASEAAAAVDIYSDIDFRAFTADGGLTVNPGEVSFVKWNGLNWIQDYYSVPAQSVPLTVTEATQYLHLIVPIKTYVSTLFNRVTPWVRQDEIDSLANEFSFAKVNEWQGVNLDDPPRYEVTGDETWAGPGTLPILSIFSCMLASINTENGLRLHHCGPVTLPQGYAGGFVHISP